MTAEDWVRIISAIAAGFVLVIGAIGAVYAQVVRTHQLVNSRMSELLELTRTSATAEGRRLGQHWPK